MSEAREQNAIPELQPCPFCGSKAVFYERADREGHSVMCTKSFCGAFISGTPVHPGIPKWNKRPRYDAAMQEKDKEIERLKAEAKSDEETIEAWINKYQGCPHVIGEGDCGCSYDNMNDVCMVHSPKLLEVTAKLAASDAMADKLAEALKDQVAAYGYTHHGHWMEAKSTLAAYNEWKGKP